MASAQGAYEPTTAAIARVKREPERGAFPAPPGALPPRRTRRLVSAIVGNVLAI
jgi:hypothetical protein